MKTFLTREEAQALLKEVDPDDILVAARMHYPSGIHDEWIGSIEELMWYLQPASEKDIPGTSIKGLAGWVRDAVGDDMLAEEILSCEAAHDNFVDACEAAYYKVQKRVEALREIAEGKMV